MAHFFGACNPFSAVFHSIFKINTPIKKPFAYARIRGNFPSCCRRFRVISLGVVSFHFLLEARNLKQRLLSLYSLNHRNSCLLDAPFVGSAQLLEILP